MILIHLCEPVILIHMNWHIFQIHAAEHSENGCISLCYKTIKY